LAGDRKLKTGFDGFRRADHGTFEKTLAGGEINPSNQSQGET
jgi:hypothetical protein